MPSKEIGPKDIIWHSFPAFAHSGYGVQTREFIWRLQERGYFSHVVMANKVSDLGGFIWNNIPHYPGGPAPWGVDGVIYWTEQLGAKLVISLLDVWALPLNFGEMVEKAGAKWMPIVPVDHDPLPDRVRQVIAGQNPFSMSLWGLEQMKANGINGKPFELGVTTSVFKPMKPNKEMILAGGKFVVGVVANNVERFDRKGLRPTARVFGRFHKKHKDSVFYFHGETSDAEDGVNLNIIANEYGFKIHGTNEWMRWLGYSSERMAELYSTFDVMLLLTRGEGFGIPLIEAQACGTPVIVTDFTAPKDLVGSGWKIPISGTRTTPLDSQFAEPDEEAALAALEEAYRLWKDKKLEDTYKDKAVAFAQPYDFDTLTDKYLIPVLEDVIGKAEKRKSPDDRVRETAIEVEGEGVRRVISGPKPVKKRRNRKRKSKGG